MRLRLILMHPKRLFLVYFAVISVGLLWLIFNIGSLCPPANQKGHQHGLPEESEFRNKEFALEEWESKLKYLERALRSKYAKEIDSILEETGYSSNAPTIYAITPTYARPVQKAELTRLKNTFLHVRHFHWIVVEDAAEKTDLVTNFLKKSGISYTHLGVGTPPEFKLQPKDPNWYKPKGVLQRNAALRWIRDNIDPDNDKGVVYFADDDNTYDLDIFEQMRYTKRISVWPVGLVGKLRFEGPVLKNGKVGGFFTYWKPDRPYPLDMAGFAINVRLLFDNLEAEFSYEVERGYQESVLLRQVGAGMRREELEPLAYNCTKVLVWHTRSERVDLRNEDKLKKKGVPGSDPNVEV